MSFASPGTQACALGLIWEWWVHESFSCLAYWWGTISLITVSTNQSFYHNNFESQQFCVITKFRVSNMTHYRSKIYEIMKDSPVKTILAFWIESGKSYFCIYYIYMIHAIAVKLDDLRTKNRCFNCSILCSYQYVRYHTINICFQNVNRLAEVPLAANGVFRILEITFIPRHFLIFCQFLHILSIWPYGSYGLSFIFKNIINQVGLSKKLSKN